jgi:hypothetical protein
LYTTVGATRRVALPPLLKLDYVTRMRGISA